MNKVILYTLLCGGLLIKSAFAEVDVAFTPSNECEQKIIALIDNSQQSIEIAVYSINNENIVAALERAKERKVAIRILTDKRQAAMKSSKVTQMHDSGFDIRVHTKNKIEHNKFAVFDGKELTTGSFNWTNAASDKNSENCMFFKHEPEQVQKFSNRFEELWKINTQAKSEEWFAKRKAKH